MSNRPRRHRPRTISASDYHPSTSAAAGSSQAGWLGSSVLWLIGRVVWIVLAVLLTVVVIGAFRFSVLAGLGTTVFALLVAYFMVRDR